MAYRGWRLAVLVGLLLCQTAVLRADDPPVFGPGFAAPPAQPAWRFPYVQNASQTGPQSDPRLSTNQPPASVYQSQSGQWPVAPVRAVSAIRPQSPENNAGAPAVNGTWREDGQYVIIDVNGQQLRLAKSALGQQQAGSPAHSQTGDGSVHGRLMQKSRPLVNCHVVIVPMHNDRGADSYDGSRQPMTTVTNEDGIYYFEHVPPGAYKLTWLPNGTNQWIRRLVVRPDVIVRPGEAVTAKEIRAAQQTIN